MRARRRVARDQPPRVGRLLFDAVAARHDAVPTATRPKLYVGGESLGAYGGNGAFTSAADMLGKVDGALWTGTPSFTPIQAELTQDRTYGSTVANPVLDDGRHIRFAEQSRAADARTSSGTSWARGTRPRVVYLQHDTDPVVWWSTDTLFRTPDWLDEPGTRQTPMSVMSWMPVVTFLRAAAWDAYPVPRPSWRSSGSSRPTRRHSMPRPWYFQGFISGITAVVFYAVGALLEDIAGWAGLTVRVNDTARRVLKADGG